jgi:hypothetical protein
MNLKLRLVGVLGVALLLSACFDLDSSGHKNGDGNTTLNQAPMITGAPSASILEGKLYVFKPDASDPDGDELEFSISRKPEWADFNPATGRLSGTPGAGDVGNFTNIVISVTDGKDTSNLAAFDISVNQIAVGQATLSWMPPTENADGSTLTDLAGYRIYYGTNPNNLNNVAVLNNPGLSRYVVENLTPARWHFTMTSVNSEGVESARSAATSKTIG